MYLNLSKSFILIARVFMKFFRGWNFVYKLILKILRYSKYAIIIIYRKIITKNLTMKLVSIILYIFFEHLIASEF